jgi:hypothetical protein
MQLVSALGTTIIGYFRAGGPLEAGVAPSLRCPDCATGGAAAEAAAGALGASLEVGWPGLRGAAAGGAEAEGAWELGGLLGASMGLSTFSLKSFSTIEKSCIIAARSKDQQTWIGLYVGVLDLTVLAAFKTVERV